mgnify:FL=1
MNCRNVFQIYLNFENCMITRVSLQMLKKETFTENMYEFFDGVAKILVPDDCKTAVVHNDWGNEQRINEFAQNKRKAWNNSFNKKKEVDSVYFLMM